VGQERQGGAVNTERDFEFKRGVRNSLRQDAREYIAEFLEAQNGFNKIDDLINGLDTDALGEADRNEIAILLRALDTVLDDLLAWAKQTHDQ
jgi:hypothetical protein